MEVRKETVRMEERKSFLVKTLHALLLSVVHSPKVSWMLTPEEADGVLLFLVERIVHGVLRREIELGREITVREFQSCVIKALDEVAPEPDYIV